MRRQMILASVVALALSACNGEVAPLGGPIQVDTTVPTTFPGVVVPSGTLTQASKVDLLLMIDNSASMEDKQEHLRRSIPDLVTRLVAPNCVDGAGNVVGRSENGVCAAGSLEFAPVTDLHVGILTSSLGNRGGDVCDVRWPRTNDRAHLVTAKAGGGNVPDAAQGFLTFGPGGITDVAQLQNDISDLVGGVGANGCGLEAQLESWYRFLVEPDPYEDVVLNGSVAEFVGTDVTVLQQRAAFLRPDSLLSLVVLTDEDDSGVDPLSMHGQGWAFMSNQFPGSTTFRKGGNSGTTAPRATSACEATPMSPDCTTCGYAANCANGTTTPDVPCTVVENDPICIDTPYYDAEDEDLNVRFVQMKRRFGVDPQYPLDRYVLGLLSAKVPDRLHDHDANGKYVNDHTCQNPIYAAALPTTVGDELCDLPAGPRSQKLVVLTVIAGAPPELLHPGMTPADWTAVVGRDPLTYDLTGIDTHMLQSTEPRPGLPPPSASMDADAVHGREWNTRKGDLQYACTFALETPRTCGADATSCDCSPETNFNPPLCNPLNPNEQIRAKAYPGIRPLALARLLGDNAVASSICPPAPVEPGTGPVVSYRPAMNELGNRMARSLVAAH
jgi:hypothetical protein